MFISSSLAQLSSANDSKLQFCKLLPTFLRLFEKRFNGHSAWHPIRVLTSTLTWWLRERRRPAATTALDLRIVSPSWRTLLICPLHPHNLCILSPSHPSHTTTALHVHFGATLDIRIIFWRDSPHTKMPITDNSCQYLASHKLQISSFPTMDERVGDKCCNLSLLPSA
jgi:hypothetical protein